MEFMVNDALAYLKAAQRVLRCAGGGNERDEAVAAALDAIEPIIAKLSHAPGNNASIDGLKVIARSGWFAARPSGTEDVYKIYAESFRGPEHLAQVQAEARDVVGAALGD